MIEVILPIGLAICAGAVVECKTLDILGAALRDGKRPDFCADGKPCDLSPSLQCAAVSRVFVSEEDAARYRIAVGWSTWYVCSAGES